MSDFFRHLVSRSRPSGEGEGAFLRPRLPSLFEGPTGAEPVGEPGRHVDLGMGETSNRATPEARRPRNSPASFDLPQEIISPFEPSRGLGTGTENSGRRRSRPDASRPDHPEENARQATSPEPESVAERDENDNPVQRSRNHLYSEEEDRFARREGQAGQIRARLHQDPAGQEESLSRAPAREMGEQAAGPRAERAARRKPADEQAAVDETRLLRPALERYRPAEEVPARTSPGAAFTGLARTLPEAREPGEERPAAPVVRISIGRIEVRAVSPAPQPAGRPVAAPRPKLSLDEYLRQRNEGKR